MNDPDVVSLEYRLVTDSTLVFNDPAPLDREVADCKMRLEDGRLTVSMKTHCATEQEARGLVEPLLRAWELDQALQRGRREFRFEFETANIVDRSPPAPGSSHVIRPRAIESISTCGPVTLIRGESRYPPPSAGLVVSADVEMLWRRYEGFVQGRELLAPMAYACFTYVIEVMAQGKPHASKKCPPKEGAPLSASSRARNRNAAIRLVRPAAGRVRSQA